MKQATTGLVALCLISVGCGGSSSSGSSASTVAATTSSTPSPTTTSSTAAPTSSATTPQPIVRALSGAHGELVEVATLAGGTTLGFLPDGASEALEIVDPSALTAAGAHEGWSLVLDGDAETNVGGLSAASEQLRIASFELDTVVVSGELTTLRTLVPPAPTVLRDVDGQHYEPTGPLAQALLAHPGGVPLRVCGRLDPQSPGTYGALLHVTAWWPAVSIGFSDMRPLLSSERFDVDDLERSGAYRLSYFMAGPGAQSRKGRGRSLPAAERARLRALVVAADLPSQPTRFQPRQIYPDHPSVTLSYGDAKGRHSVTIYSGAPNVPAELTDLLSELRDRSAAVPALRSVEQGDQSRIDKAEVRVARDMAAWQTLYAQHDPTTRTPPQVDFTQEGVVGVFLGFRSTGGYSVEVTRLERIGNAFYLTSEERRPSGPAPSVITAPYHLVAIEGLGQASVYVDGQKR